MHLLRQAERWSVIGRWRVDVMAMQWFWITIIYWQED